MSKTCLWQPHAHKRVSLAQDTQSPYIMLVKHSWIGMARGDGHVQHSMQAHRSRLVPGSDHFAIVNALADVAVMRSAAPG